MKKPKFIEDTERQQYKANLESFLKVVNPPKYSDAEIEQIKNELRKERGI